MDFTQEKCPICYESFNYSKKPYLLLLCGHTFCSPCISRIKKECIEDDSKYKTLSEFYSEQKKKFYLCDSQTSVFSDNCKKKSSSEKDDESENKEENAPSFNISHQSDSYIEIDSNEEKEKINEKETEALEETKNNENINQNNNEENNEYIANSLESDFNNEEDDENEEEEDEENISKSEEEDEEKEESDDNSEKSINDINDIIAINDIENKKDKKNKKKHSNFDVLFVCFELKSQIKN